MGCILYMHSNYRPFLLSFLNRLSNCLFPICVPIHVDPGNGGVRNQSQSWDGLDLYQCGLSLSMRGLFKSLYTVGDQRDGLFSLRDAPNLWARLASACARSLIQSDLKKAKRVALGGRTHSGPENVKKSWPKNS